ncbi:MAG: GntR family transcriptional regulator [Pelagimonas sp.]|uniref:GntR family transcriptional regulator n=1 Tax=Pelagimonas sp. TaxID=2073170 RepID=UPI003D6C55F7
MVHSVISHLKAPAPQTASDQIFQVLYAAVISLELPPGLKISETEIAKQMGVSRQPVRDAFYRLSKLGFLWVRPQRAAQITKISEQGVLDAVFLRIAIEVECLRAAMSNLTDHDTMMLRANLAQQETALEDPDPALFHKLDEALHEKICEIAGHPHAWTLIQEQKAHVDRIRFLTLTHERRKSVLQEHHKVVDAIVSRDAELAQQSLREHLSTVRRDLTRIRSDFPDYFAS